MSSTQEKLDQVFFEQLRGKTITKEQDHILEWASQRLKPALARLIDSAKQEAYKQGYIDAGIKALTEQLKESE